MNNNKLPEPNFLESVKSFVVAEYKRFLTYLFIFGLLFLLYNLIRRQSIYFIKEVVTYKNLIINSIPKILGYYTIKPDKTLQMTISLKKLNLIYEGYSIKFDLSKYTKIEDIKNGKISVEDSPLRHAPHTSSDVLRDQWDRKYSRSVGGLPIELTAEMGAKGKYWPTVGRIDGVHGDRNLICACPPVESYA